MRTRAEIEQDIRAWPADRKLYVSPEGVASVHRRLDELLVEWEAAAGGSPALRQP